MGMSALAVASFILSGLELGWIGSSSSTAVGLLILCFAMPLQSASSVLGFLARDPVAGTGMGVLAGTWLATGAVTYTSRPGSTSAALGLLLVASSAALLVPAIAGSAGKAGAAVLLLVVAARFAVAGCYEITGSSGCQTAAGALGLVVSAGALYLALAFELEGVHGNPVLPVGRRGRARSAMRITPGAEVVGLYHEPGVRSEL
jgi:hypothetical protein